MSDLTRLPGPVVEIWDWQLRAACRGVANEVFFHPDNERGQARSGRDAAAKAICSKCPVIQACRAHALSVREPYGVWGGMSEDDRQTYLDELEATKEATVAECDDRGVLSA